MPTVGNIADGCDTTDLIRDESGRITVPVEDPDFCSLGREETAHGGADSASTTGDHRSMPVQHAHGGDPVTSTAPACRSTLTSMDQDDLRQRLADERNRLESVRAGFAAEHLRDESEDESMSELSHLAQHSADVATETFEREKDFSILEQVEAELADVERAMRRIDEGTYGRCEACGGAIGDDRLEAMPAARFCIAHQTQAEAGAT